MASVSMKVDPIDKDIDFFIREDLSPEARQRAFVELGREAIAETDTHNERILNRKPIRTITPALESAREGGSVFVQYDLMNDVLRWIAEQLQTHSPVLTGEYKQSHTLFADGTEVPVNEHIPRAEEYLFLTNIPYTRKIELGSSPQAPNGVYEPVATLAGKRFGNIARVRFSYRTALGDAIIGGKIGNRSETRVPAIIVTVR